MFKSFIPGPTDLSRCVLETFFSLLSEAAVVQLTGTSLVLQHNYTEQMLKLGI